ncbi:hypothetical protein [Vibrio algarum]|uniref:Lipoprotein n=1 Tax=Vibrio algarum TaxID=3020714 RepID=A0ABT4YNV2_9VIBR|nr:hypothetical protein [Vibrio sp. KJ40-1]MDB1123130.1 hypothetical protein [Vibrio sp. KJ40-1]
MKPLKHIKPLTIIFSALVLSACVDKIAERNGVQLQVVPITYSLDLSVKKEKNDAAWRELDQYVENNWEKIVSQQLTFTWYSDTGKKLAEDYQKHLLSKGINRNQITLSQGILQEDMTKDLKFEIIVNKVFSEVCGYEKSGTFDNSVGGCYAESARWQSMVNPEKMLTDNINK